MLFLHVAVTILAPTQYSATVIAGEGALGFFRIESVHFRNMEQELTCTRIYFGAHL